MDVSYVVAPYEADSQMAHLWRTKKVSAIITEDSDLIAFGCDKVRQIAQVLQQTAPPISLHGKH